MWNEKKNKPVTKNGLEKLVFFSITRQQFCYVVDEFEGLRKFFVKLLELRTGNYRESNL